MEWMKKRFDKANIDKIATIIAIIIGIPPFYEWVKGNMTFEIFISILSILLFALLILSRYSGNKIIKKCRELETEVTTWKDRAASWQEKANSSKIDAETLSGQLRESQDTIQKEGARSDNLKRAYIRLRYAYKKAAGITTRDASIGIGMKDVNEDSVVHLQQLDEYHLYLEAEKLAKENGILEDA
jgi:hypothetical protein